MKTILISAGHSDSDPGAVSGTYKEATLAKLMRDRIYHSLCAMKIPTIRDGDDGVNDPLRKAISLCGKADIAVEIHFNAGASTAHGVEALAKPAQKKLAQALCHAIHKSTGITLRGDYGYRPDDSGQHHRLGFCEAGGIVLETCFITSRDDMAFYASNKVAVAKAVAGVLAAYAMRK